MSLLLENHLTTATPEEAAFGKKYQCWEFLSCSRVLCPAYRNRDADCWLIPKTHCNSCIEKDFFRKLSACLTCSYFKGRWEQQSKDWNNFLAEQLRNYNVKALELIYQKEESFVDILNRIPDGLFTTDQEWRITYFNPAAEKITGFTAEDAVGMYCKDVFKNSICDSDCALKRAVRDGNNIHNREYEITNIEGKKIPIICSTSAFRDNQGRVAGGLEIFKDITELRRLQKEIARREKKYRRIFEGSHDMIYTTNQLGKILDVNQAGVEMMGYPSKKTMLGLRSARALYRNAKDRDKFINLMNRNGYVKDFEVDFKKHDNIPIHVLISSRRYENPHTGDIEFEGIIKDITQRKRAEENLKQRNRELSILNGIAVALNHTMDLNHILQVTLKNVLKVLQISSGGLFLIDRYKKQARLQVSYGIVEQESDQPCEIIFKDNLLRKHLIEQDVELMPKPSFPSFQVKCEVKGQKSANWLTSFLITFKGRVVGFFGLDIPPVKVLSRHEIHLLGSLGNFLGGAIENTQLLKTIRRHRQELRKLTEKLFQTQEEERRRIARELHDEAGQALTAVKLSLDRLEGKISEHSGLKEDLAEIRKMIVRTSSEIRQLSYRLHPTLLSDLGLEPALNLYFKEVSNHSGLEIDFRMVGFDRRLDPEMETVFYRFSQEALTNTLKHSGAENFRLSIIKSFPRIIFAAEDDGNGFSGHIKERDQRSLGLLGMRERASLLGGTFHLRGNPGKGTRIRIEIPLTDG